MKKQAIVGETYTHREGTAYIVMSRCYDATNARDGRIVVQYQAADPKKRRPLPFVRDEEEFCDGRFNGVFTMAEDFV